MKIYRNTVAVFDEIERRLATTAPSLPPSPLPEIIELLCCARHYTWVGIYITAGASDRRLLGAGGEPHPAQMARAETKSKVLVSMKLAGRELGVLDVESDRENAFRPADRVLLENVANLLARFLAGPGRYVARKARAQVIARPWIMERRQE